MIINYFHPTDLENEVPYVKDVTSLINARNTYGKGDIHLNNVLLENVVPMELAGRLPARLSAGGELMMQARPGRWEVRLVGRAWTPLTDGKSGLASGSGCIDTHIINLSV